MGLCLLPSYPRRDFQRTDGIIPPTMSEMTAPLQSAPWAAMMSTDISMELQGSSSLLNFEWLSISFKGTRARGI